MNELQRWAAGASAVVPSKEERQHNRAVNNLVRETKFAGLRVDAEAAITGRIMERAVDIDQYRKNLAGNDETLNMVLTRIELGMVEKMQRVQKNFGSEFPL
jgi:hypothetical protein